MIDETLARRYLLGQLPPEERQEFETQYFSDAAVFEELVAIENDLIDCYTRAELRGLEKQQFEQRYCSSREGRSRIQFSMALTEIVRSSHGAVKSKEFKFAELFRRPFEFGGQSFQWALGAICMVMCVAVIFLTFRNRDLNRKLLNARNSETELRTQRDEAVGQIARLSQSTQQLASDEKEEHLARRTVPDLTFALVAGILRGESGQQVLTVPRDRPWIRLEMPIDEDPFNGYEAVLYTVEMHEVRREESLKSRSTVTGIKVDWRIPSDSIKSGDYILELNGKQDGNVTERLSVYSFHLVRK